MSTAHFASGATRSTQPNERLYSLLGGILRIAICTVLILAPLAFGAVEPWARFTLQLGGVVLFGLWAARQLVAGEIHIRPSWIYLPAGLFALLVLAQFAFGATAYRYATKEQLLIYAAYGLVAFVALQSYRREVHLRFLVYALGAFGFLVAIFAILQDLSSNGRIYWLRTVTDNSGIFGPYVNYNHFAGLMEMLSPFCLVLALSQELDIGPRLMAGFAGVTMAASLVISASRGGMIAFLVEIAFLGLVMAVLQKSRGLFFTVLLVLVCVLALAKFAGMDMALFRVMNTRNNVQRDLMRWYVVRDSVAMVKAHPWFGWGFGTFPTVYPPFRSFFTNEFVNEAHDDYVQVLVETGFAGFACVLAFLFVVYRSGFQKLRDWRVRFKGLATLAMLTGITGVLVHSFTDFNLQVPANALLFFTLCALAAAPSDHTVRVSQSESELLRSRRQGGRAGVVIDADED